MSAMSREFAKREEARAALVAAGGWPADEPEQTEDDACDAALLAAIREADGPLDTPEDACAH